MPVTEAGDIQWLLSSGDRRTGVGVVRTCDCLEARVDEGEEAVVATFALGQGQAGQDHLQGRLAVRLELARAIGFLIS